MLPKRLELFKKISSIKKNVAGASKIKLISIFGLYDKREFF